MPGASSAPAGRTDARREHVEAHGDVEGRRDRPGRRDAAHIYAAIPEPACTRARHLLLRSAIERFAEEEPSRPDDLTTMRPSLTAGASVSIALLRRPHVDERDHRHDRRQRPRPRPRSPPASGNRSHGRPRGTRCGPTTPRRARVRRARLSGGARGAANACRESGRDHLDHGGAVDSLRPPARDDRAIEEGEDSQTSRTTPPRPPPPDHPHPGVETIVERLRRERPAPSSRSSHGRTWTRRAIGARP